MKTDLRSVSFCSGALVATFAVVVAPLASAKTSVASSPKTPTVKTSSMKANAVSLPKKIMPAKTFNPALDADLIAAVVADDTAKVRDLLARNANPDVKGSGGSIEPVLTTATLAGNTDIVRALLDAGANVEATTVQGNPPLTLAAVKGRVEITKLLLQHGAQVDAKTRDDVTPLMLAARSGETDVVRLLIAAGADVNVRANYAVNNRTPLHYACEDSSFGPVKLDVVKMLVEAGADVSLQDSEGKTALQNVIARKIATKSNAVFYVMADIEKYLTPIYNRDAALFMAIGKLYTDNGNLNSSTRSANWQAAKAALADGATGRFTDNASGGTTLIFASYGLRDADDATMQTLVARSNLNAREKQFGFTALHVAVTNNNLKMIGWLIQARANLNLLDRNQKTPLDLAVKNPAASALLKKAGAKTYAEVRAEENRLIMLTWTQEERDSLLYKALQGENPNWDEVQYALDAGAAGRNVSERFSNTALMILADKMSASDGMIAKFIARGDVNAVTEQGSSALHEAAWMGNDRMIVALLKAGAKVNLIRTKADGVKETALDQAIEQKKTTTVALLRKAGAKTYAELKKSGAPSATPSTPAAPKATPPKTTTPSTTAPQSNYQPTANDKALYEAVAEISDKNFYEEEVTEADWDVVRKLLDGGATARYANEANNETALMIIAIGVPGTDDALEQKILARSDANAQDKLKMTALHQAVEIGNAKMVGWLIKARANLNVLNDDNRTPLDLALMYKRLNIITLLQNAGAKTYAQLK